jgi:hypothetical protein
MSDLTVMGDVIMPTDCVVKKGITLTLAAGTVIHAGPGATLQVSGTLQVNGASGSPVSLQSKAHTGQDQWVGLEVTGTGNVIASYLEIHDAKTAFQADPNCKYKLDHITFDTSSVLLRLDSTGTVSKGALHGLDNKQPNDVVIIGNNHSAAPTLSDLLIDQSGGRTAVHVRDSASAPIFDHLEIAGAGAGFHLEDGTGITIKNASIHDCDTGIVEENATKSVVTASNFTKNMTHVGGCMTGDITLTGCYTDATAFDAACAMQTINMPAMKANGDVGPRP